MGAMWIDTAAQYNHAMKTQVTPVLPPPESEMSQWNLFEETALWRFHYIQMINCRVDSYELASALGKKADFQVGVLSTQSVEQRKDHDRIPEIWNKVGDRKSVSAGSRRSSLRGIALENPPRVKPPMKLF